MSRDKILFQPQPGAQESFLATEADICLYGGAAGGGKTFGLLLDGCRNVDLKEYHAVIFRRESTEIDKPGGLLAEAKNLFTILGGIVHKQTHKWTFTNTVDIQLAGLQYDDSVKAWHSSQLDFLGFDELPTFTEHQFWYMMSRMRSRSGEINPYCRCTCNPEPGWVRDLIDWWIGKDGFAIPERSGVIRWLVRSNDQTFWFDSKQSALKWIVERDFEIKPTSFTFIPATIEDNQILMNRNPEYLSRLYSLNEVEKQRLLHGNWNISHEGKLFKAEWFKYFAILPAFDFKIITVDTAQEVKTANDYTVMQVWIRANNRIFLERQIKGKFEFNEQVTILRNLALNAKPNRICVERKANGSALMQAIRREVSIPIFAIERSKDKYMRGYDVQGYVEGGYVYLNPNADYYTDFIAEITQFAPENKNKSGIHDDQVDCMMDAVEILLKNNINDVNIGNSSSDTLIKYYYETNKPKQSLKSF